MRKSLRLRWLLLLPILFWFGCENDKSTPGPVTPTTPVPPVAKARKVTVFTNQTGDPTAEALQAQVVGPDEAYKVNFYGTFDANKRPMAVRSVTVQRQHSDTTAHFVLNSQTSRLETVYLDVKGVKLPVVIKHEYLPNNPNAVRVSLYAYNWQTNTGTLKNETLFQKANGVATQTPVFVARRGASFSDVLAGVGAGVAIVETLVYSFGGVGIISTYGPAAITAIPAAGPAIAVTVVSVALIITALEAGAAVPDPSDAITPAGTPPTHPSTVPSPASLPNSPCAGTSLTFGASMDSQGSILVSGVNGSVGPYSYAVNNQSFQSGEVFANNYAAGTYSIYVRDGRGCVSAQLRTFSRPVPLTGSLIGKWSLTKTCNKSGQCGLDVPLSFEFMADGKFEAREYKDGVLRKITIGTYTIKDRILNLSWVDNGVSRSVSYSIVSITAQELILFLDKTIFDNAEDLDACFKR